MNAADFPAVARAFADERDIERQMMLAEWREVDEAAKAQRVGLPVTIAEAFINDLQNIDNDDALVLLAAIHQGLRKSNMHIESRQSLAHEIAILVAWLDEELQSEAV